MLAGLFPQSQSVLALALLVIFTLLSLSLPSLSLPPFVAPSLYYVLRQSYAASSLPSMWLTVTWTSRKHFLHISPGNCTTHEHSVLPPHLPFMSSSPLLHDHGSGGCEQLPVHRFTVRTDSWSKTTCCSVENGARG